MFGARFLRRRSVGSYTPPALTVPVITGVPTISGTENVGQTLTATPASVAGNPAPTTTWQWERSGTPIAGATSSTYTLVGDDEGTTLTVVQTETNSEGSDTAESAATGTIGAALTAPVITGVPTISGTEQVGETLTASAASVAGNPTPTRTWQWERSNVAISGATSSTYTLVSADEGETITVVQTETNSEGSDSAESAATGTISALFDPATLFASSEPGGWWEVKLGAIWQDTAGTTAADTAGQTVARVDDLSGNGNHLLQSTASARPTLRQAAGGQWYLEFDGTNDFLIFTDFMADAVGAGAGATAVVAAEINGASTATAMSEGYTVSTTPVFDVIRAGATASQFGPVFRGDSFTTYVDRTGTGGGADNTRRILTVDMSGSTTATRVDGVADLASAAFTYATTTVNRGAFGCFPRGAPALFCDMNLYGAIARGDQMSGAQISDTEAYLADFAGVTL